MVRPTTLSVEAEYDEMSTFADLLVDLQNVTFGLKPFANLTVDGVVISKHERFMQPIEIFQCTVMFLIMFGCFAFAIVMAKRLTMKEAELNRIYLLSKNEASDDPLLVDLKTSEDSMFNASQILQFSTALIPPLNRKYRRKSKSSASADKSYTPDSQTTSRPKSPFREGFEAFKKKMRWTRKKSKIKPPIVETNDEVQVEVDESVKTARMPDATPSTKTAQMPQTPSAFTPASEAPKLDSTQLSQAVSST